MKFGRVVLKVNTHRLRESRDFRFDATLSRWRPSWRHFTRNNAATWLVHTQRQPGTYAAASASYWSIVHSYVFYGCHLIWWTPVIEATHDQETCVRNLHRIERSSIPCMFGTGGFQTQPTNQTAQFWSRASVQVSCISFFSVCHCPN